MSNRRRSHADASRSLRSGASSPSSVHADGAVHRSAASSTSPVCANKTLFPQLFDDIRDVSRSNGFGIGLFHDSEVSPISLRTTAGRSWFLAKVIALTELCLGYSLGVRPSEILSGFDDRAANKLLDAVKLAAAQPSESAASQAAVARVRSSAALQLRRRLAVIKLQSLWRGHRLRRCMLIAEPGLPRRHNAASRDSGDQPTDSQRERSPTGRPTTAMANQLKIDALARSLRSGTVSREEGGVVRGQILCDAVAGSSGASLLARLRDTHTRRKDIANVLRPLRRRVVSPRTERGTSPQLTSVSALRQRRGTRHRSPLPRPMRRQTSSGTIKSQSKDGLFDQDWLASFDALFRVQQTELKFQRKGMYP